MVPGLVVCAAVVAGAIAISVFGQLGTIHSPTTRFYVATSRARGLISGADVWLDGVRVGVVRWVRFQPPTTDTTRRLLLALDVVSDVRERVRQDTRVAIAPGGDMLGSPVVQLFGGSTRARPVAENDTLVSLAVDQLLGTREQLANAAQDLPVVLDNFNAVRDALSAHTGTIGALGSEEDAHSLHVLHGEASQLTAGGGYRRGTVALVLSDSFASRVRAVLARADTVTEAASRRTAALRSGSRTADQPGGNRHSLTGTMSQVDSQLTALRDQLARMRSRRSADTTLASLRAEVAEARARLQSLEGDVAHHPLRYIDF